MIRLLSFVVAISVCIVAQAHADPEADQLKARVSQLEAEVKLLKERLAKLEATRPAPRVLKISVMPGEWGSAPTDDIAAVCRSCAAELTRYFPDRDWDPVTVHNDPKQGPMVIYGRGHEGERRVLLNTKDTYWAQYSYQFAHELCHVLCNYRDGSRVNLWFEESLCETASLFVLKRMAETWKTKPPYGNWKSYADKLGDYAQKRIGETGKLTDLTLAQWYQREEPALRKNGTDRARNNIVAMYLLELFEKNPDHWKAVAYLNQADPKREPSLAEYLADWRSRVPEAQKSFVSDVAVLFGVKLP